MSAPHSPALSPLLAAIAREIDTSRRMLHGIEAAIAGCCTSGAAPGAFAGLQGIDRLGQRLADLATLLAALAEQGGALPPDPARLAAGLNLAEIRALVLPDAVTDCETGDADATWLL
ncbi:hypothetical protein [Pseudogemmobacter humi]|uniref:Uncharacterized protein n=1 Tax=Pseudogemmobacter humi TaxID=2483812 RepID=A0A3P5XIP4_9RHOB|nr:hypothetical protein [Pseudogemmobacter humi]VDC30708.1 hypothetical protein XINFAN_02650 [Pseudogemmobacter humi]